MVFNEVHYHPENDETTLEYLELYNQLAVEVDLSNWRLDGDIDFDFPEGTIISGRGYLVVAKDPAALSAATGHNAALGPYNRNLSNSEGTVFLYNNNLSFRSQAGSGSIGSATSDLEGRRRMDELHFSDVAPWPTGPDGSGLTLAKRDPSTGTAEPKNWTVSNQANGTPGSENTFLNLPQLSFNEVSPALDSNFRIELFNRGDSPLALQDLVLTSSDDLAPDYLFPAETLAPGSFLTIDAAILGFTPDDNDRLFLYGAGKSFLIDSIRIAESARARSPDGIGRWARPTSLTFGAANQVTVEDGIVINEIFYHAKPQIASGGVTFSSVPVLNFDSNWRYNLNAGTAGLPSGWEDTAHPVDGVNWAEGPGLLGVENATLGEPLRTPLTKTSQISYYFETEFNYDGTAPVSEMQIQHYLDDGAVFYLNGVEIGRYNLEPGVVTPTTEAFPGVGNASLQSLVLSSPDIQPGSNRLSVEVHQINSTSSDIVFGASVILETETLTDFVPYQEREEEWLELYNRSNNPIDLTDWELDGGIEYDFPAGTILLPDNYLVVAKDASALSSKHPTATIIGDYSGRLGNSGDLVELKDGNNNIADEVNYYDSGKWPTTADGGGSSLELVDPDTNNNTADAWAASNESDRNSWQTYSYEAIATEDGIGDQLFHELQIGLLDAGELLLDDVSVIESNATEFIQNGDFESDPLGSTPDKWRVIGTHGSHGNTVVIADPDDPGNQCLHVVSTGPTENKHNKLETTFANSEEVVIGNTYQIRFRAKWVSGSNQLNTRLYFNYLQKTHVLNAAETWGTPGSANTAAIPNAGPSLSNLSHSPVVPDAGEAVTVNIKASDPDGISSLTLHYSVNGASYQSRSMSLSDELFTATIPGQSASAVVHFYVEGLDSSNRVSSFPEGSTEGGAFYKVQDGLADTSGLRHNFRIIMAESDRSFLFLNTNRMSNDRFRATVIEDEETVYYDVRLRLKASAHGRFQNASYGFNIRFHPDQKFRGVHDSISVERGALSQQLMAKYLTNRAGGGYWSFYDDVAYIIPPTEARRGVGLLSMSRHTGSFWDGLFPEEEESGTLFNLELHYNPTTTDTGGPEGLKIGTPRTQEKGKYRLIDRGGDKEPYRWGFQIRSGRDRDDYSQIIALNQAIGNLSGSALKTALDDLIDVDQWMRTFAMLSLNGSDDIYGRLWEHNFRFYVRPTDGKIICLQWDLDRTFRLAANAPVVPTVNRDGTPYPVAKVFAIPEYRRIFDGHVDDLIQTTFNSDYLASTQSGLAAAIGSGVNFTNYVTNRAEFMQTRLPSPAAFTITTNGGADFSESDSAVDLTGTGSYEVFSIEVNGTETPITWTGADSWQVTVPIGVGPNPLVLTARNYHGVEVGNDFITVTNTSNVDLANVGNTLISELHYHPALPNDAEIEEGHNVDNDFEFIELANTSNSFVDYTNVTFTNGLTFTMPVGTVLAPGERVVLVADEEAFEFRYGVDLVRIVGEFTGNLSNSGERIRLAAADGSTIVDFTYSDDEPWPEESDGDGYSLVLRGDDPILSSDWRLSTSFGGNPGSTDSIPFIGGNLVDYLLADSPAPIPTSDSFFLQFSLNRAADDATFEVQFSKDLILWTSATSADQFSRVIHPDGTTSYIYEAPDALDADISHFGRIRIQAP